jgi:signal transduction histidine kinase
MKLSRLLNTEGASPVVRQKMNVAYALIFGAYMTAWPFFLVSWFAHNATMIAVLAFLISVMTVCLIWLRQTRRYQVAVWVFSFSVVAVEPWLINNNLLNGGLAYALYAGIPVFYLIGGTRLGNVWVLSSLGVMMALMNLQIAGRLTLPMNTPMFIGYVFFIFETAVFVYIYAREKEHLSQTLEEQKAGVEQQVEIRTHQYQEERAKLAASIESLRTGFIIVDDEMRLLSINEAGRQILTKPASGQDDQLAAGIGTFSDLSSQLQGCYDLAAAIRRCLAQKQPVSAGDLPFDTHFLAIAITPILDQQAVIGVVVLVEDITDRKALERSRDEFFSIASHELRTPLTAIMGNASMALDYYGRMSDADRKEMLGEIRTSGKRLITIVSDFLDTSRLEQGEMQFNLAVVDARQVANEVIKEAKAGGAKRQPAFKVLPAGTGPLMVKADRDKLKQILTNLVSNAVKYTPKGSITITITPDGSRLRLAVTDTGAGIPVKFQHLLFRKFQQASNDILTRDSTQSTGLGLYISKMLAEGMGGTLRLERTELNKGSTFTLELPLS